jgi:TRAP-type C4-dicarboxylate transport system substrate-binding protein
MQDMIKKLFYIILFMALTACSDKEKEQHTWDMPTPFPDNTFHTMNVRDFARDIERLTEGKIRLKVHAAASLYKHPEIKHAVQTAQVPIGEMVMSLLGNENPVFEIDSLPLLATSYEQAMKLWRVSRPLIEKLLEEQGLKLLYAVPWPPQGLYLKKEINSFDDFKGLKVRVYNATLTRLVELMGGNPTTVQTPEIPQAFSTGVIDAMITSPSTGVSSQVWDFINFYYDLQTWIPKNMVIINKKVFESLKPATQDSILQAALMAETRGWELSQRETDEKIKILADHGIKIVQPPHKLNEDLQRIRLVMINEWQNKAGSLGREVLENYYRN